MTLNAVKRQCFSVSGDMFLCLSSVPDVIVGVVLVPGPVENLRAEAMSPTASKRPGILRPRQRPHPELQTALDRDVQRERAGQGRTNKHLKMKKSECIDMN